MPSRRRPPVPDDQHVCHACGCDVVVPPRMLMCRTHWAQVPYRLRKRVWATYRPGQEITKDPSEAYLRAAAAAVRAVPAVRRAPPSDEPRIKLMAGPLHGKSVLARAVEGAVAIEVPVQGDMQFAAVRYERRKGGSFQYDGVVLHGGVHRGSLTQEAVDATSCCTRFGPPTRVMADGDPEEEHTTHGIAARTAAPREDPT